MQRKKGVTKKTTFYYRASQVNISVVFFGFCCFHEAGLRDAEALGLRSNVVHRNLLLSALERLSHWQQAIDNLRDLRDESLEVALEFPQINGMRPKNWWLISVTKNMAWPCLKGWYVLQKNGHIHKCWGHSGDHEHGEQLLCQGFWMAEGLRSLWSHQATEFAAGDDLVRFHVSPSRIGWTSL